MHTSELYFIFQDVGAQHKLPDEKPIYIFIGLLIHLCH